MARYNRFEYGTGIKYGVQAAQSTLSWAFEVDWDGDGIYNGDNEGQKMLRYSLNRGRENLIKSDGSGFEEIRPGELSVTLDNSSKRYDPFNTLSPLYPYVRPGVLCKVRVKDDMTGTIYERFAGYITDIQPNYEDYTVRITAIDGLQALAERDVIDAVYTSLNVATALGYILTGADWGWGSSIEDNLDTFPYWWTDSDGKALQGVRDICEAMLGTAFVSEDGSFKFYTRTHNPSIVLSITQDQLRRIIKIPQPWEVIRNLISISSHPRRIYTTVELWRLQDAAFVKAGENIEIWTNYQYNGETVPAINVITPVATTDYTMNSAADGSGTNQTANWSVTATKFSTATKLVVSNNGSVDGYITLLKLRGDALSSLNTVTVRKEDADSEDLYGKRRFTMSPTLLQDTTMLNDYTTYLESVLPEPRAFPKVQVISRPEIQFGLDLFDRITLTINELNISGDYDLGYIREEFLSNGGQAVLTTFSFEPGRDALWVFTATVGATTRFAY